MLKQQLRFFIEDLKMMIDEIEMLLMNQRKKYHFKVETAKMRVFFRYQILLFRDFIFKVTSYALNLIYKQFLFAQKKKTFR